MTGTDYKYIHRLVGTFKRQAKYYQQRCKELREQARRDDYSQIQKMNLYSDASINEAYARAKQACADKLDLQLDKCLQKSIRKHTK